MTQLADDVVLLIPRGSAQDWDEEAILLLALVSLADVESARRLWRRLVPARYRTLLDAGTPLSVFIYDDEQQRYRPNVDERTLRNLHRTAIEGASDMAEAESLALATGRLEIDQWQDAMVALIKPLAVALFALGRGGFERMTAADFEAVSETLEFQFTKLRDFALQIEAGRVSPERVSSRARLYPQSTALLFHQGRRTSHEEAGYTQERRVLTPAEHCSECPGLAAMGWQPIGTLPDIGLQPCLWNCKCYWEWR